ncbi:MAG: protein kinase [Candidatus Aminicenantes bacterium]|nr:protein kinase [Candidatus Aminicenantes bacterium]
MPIECPKCHFENPDNTVYCGKCATPLPSSEDISSLPTKTIETPATELTRGTTFASRYEIIEELGKGGMGEVYRVEDKKIKEEVALKLIKPEIASDKRTIERFSNELRMARKIAHRNVCRMFDLGEEQGMHYITMEYVSGEDLRSFIRRSRQLTVGTAVTIAKQVGEGLAEAHRLGVIHRDLKPGNIMIDRDGNARIMDFGIARSLKSKGVTGAGVMVGTPEYMSPEQVEGLEIEQRSDLYSLGVILYEMVTGKIPFAGETPLSIAMKHKSEKPQDPSEVNPQIPEGLSRVILRCLEKDKEKRYRTAEEFLSELSKIEEGIPTEERVIPRKKPSTSREITVTFNLKKILIPAFAVVVLAVVAVLIFHPFSKREFAPIPSDKPSLAVMYFKNNTGDENLDHWRNALSDLLITDLSQSKHIRVLSAERLFDILQQLDQLDANAYSSQVLKEVAARGGVESVLVGNYTRANDTFRINVSLQKASTGELIGSESVEGHGEKDFYAMVDELTKRIKVNFKLSERQIITDIDEEVGKITTASPEAYKLYSEGRRYHLNGEYPKSIESMLKAVEIDPDFAMAYRSMANAYGNLGFRPARKNARQKAFELRDRVSERERYLIEGDYYWTSEKTSDKAIEAFERLLEIYPGDPIAITNLGGVYSTKEEWDKSLELHRALLSNRPVNFLVYWNVTEMYMVKGMYDIARQVIMSALNDYPDNENFYELSTLIYACQGEYDSALDEVEKAISLRRDISPFALKGDIFHLKGNFDEAEKTYKKFGVGAAGFLANLKLSQGKLVELRDTLKQIPQDKKAQFAHFYLKVGEFEEALKLFDELINDDVKNERVYGQIVDTYHKGLAYLGMKSIPDAVRTAEELRKLIQESPYRKATRYHQHLMGRIELERENYPKAIDYFQKAISLLPYTQDGRKDYRPWFVNSLAQAYYRAEDLEKAREEYERIVTLTYPRLWDGDIYAKGFYMLGRIYERMRKKAEAIEHYEKFLQLWKDADPGIAEVKDARERLAGLKSQS